MNLCIDSIDSKKLKGAVAWENIAYVRKNLRDNSVGVALYDTSTQVLTAVTAYPEEVLRNAVVQGMDFTDVQRPAAVKRFNELADALIELMKKPKKNGK